MTKSQLEIKLIEIRLLHEKLITLLRIDGQDTKQKVLELLEKYDRSQQCE